MLAEVGAFWLMKFLEDVGTAAQGILTRTLIGPRITRE